MAKTAKKGGKKMEETIATETPESANESVVEMAATDENSNEATEEAGPLTVDDMSAVQFIDTFEKNINALTESVWKAVVDANQGGIFVNRNIASAAFSEVMLRICVAQAKSVEGGVERFKEILDL